MPKKSRRLSFSVKKLPKSHARTRRDGAVVRPTFTREELLNAESAVGRTVFGPIPAGTKREFFMPMKNVWLWHENGMTMRYEVRRSGVYKKVQDSKKNYVRLEGAELDNFVKAARAYLQLVKAKIY